MYPNRGAGYTFGSGVVHKFLETNNMSHILRAHQLCMEGYSSLFDKHLSTVWSAPNYCYRCGNSASILEVGPGGTMYFNVFEAAPENERDGPSHQAAQSAGGKVGDQCLAWFLLGGDLVCVDTNGVLTHVLASRILFVDAPLRSPYPPSADVGSAIMHVGDPYTYTLLLVTVTVTLLMHYYRYRQLFSWDAFRTLYPCGIMPCLVAPTPWSCNPEPFGCHRPLFSLDRRG